MRTHQVPAGADGMALGRYIRRAYPMCDAAMLRRALARRDFKLDGVRLGERDAVRAGGELSCYIADEYLLGGPLEVVYRGARVAGVVKPAGLSCQRDAQGLGEDTLEARISELFGEAYLVNRLDHFTGGVMPVALDAAARDAMLAEFRRHAVDKRYVCQVVGEPALRARLVNYAVKSADEAIVRVYDAPRPGALTMALEYELIGREVLAGGEVARLRVKLETGRTHQIRAQLSHAGLPVLGDDRYGDRAANRAHGATHQRLWCERVAFEGCEFAGLVLEAPAPF